MPTSAKDVMDLFTQVVPLLNDQQLSSLRKVLQKSKPPSTAIPVFRAAQQSRHAAKKASLQPFVPVAKALVHLLDTDHALCLRWGDDGEVTLWGETDVSHPNQPLVLRRTYHIESPGLGQHVIGVGAIQAPYTKRKILDRLFMTVLYLLHRISAVLRPGQQIVVDSFGPHVAQFGYPLLPTAQEPGFLQVVRQRVEQQQYAGRRLTLDTSARRPLWIQGIVAH